MNPFHSGQNGMAIPFWPEWNVSIPFLSEWKPSFQKERNGHVLGKVKVGITLDHKVMKFPTLRPSLPPHRRTDTVRGGFLGPLWLGRSKSIFWVRLRIGLH